MNKQKVMVTIKGTVLVIVGVIVGVFLSNKNSYNKMGYISDLAIDEIAPETFKQRAIEPTNAPARMITQNIYLALKTAKVPEVINQIQEETEKNGGFLVNKNTSKHEGILTGNISVRIPKEKVGGLISVLKNRKEIEVLQEQYNSRDITDQYTDLQARLNTLEHTKAIFEKMLDEATNFDQILRAQKEILNTQRQIDNIKGQMKYAEETAKYTLVNIDITSDELALGYKPQDNWKPTIVLKRAIRSLVRTLRLAGTTLIWAVVYSPLVLVGIGIAKLVQKLSKKEK